MKIELQKLFEGETGLNEEFMAKVNTLVESRVEEVRLVAIKETEDRLNLEMVNLVEAHKVELAQVQESAVENLTAKVTAFLDSAVLEWANENAIGLDATIKSEAAEKILSGAAQWFGEANIAVHGDADGVISALTERVNVAEAEATALREQQHTLEEAEAKRARESVLLKVCEGLALSQIETIRGCVEGIPMSESFEGRVSRFRDLIEKKEEKDPKDPKDPEGKDKDPKKDPEGKDKDGEDLNEMDQSIKSQIAQYLAS